MRTRLRIALGASLCCVAAAGCGGGDGSDHIDARSLRWIAVQPYPEGLPTAFSRARRGIPAGVPRLGSLASSIPAPLPPASSEQHCATGTYLIVQPARGRPRAYGPCRRPDWANRVIREMSQRG